jgi:uncharacterized membrane protein YbhN (UPF0104 family)
MSKTVNASRQATWRDRLKPLKWILGLGLIIAALVVVVRQRAVVESALDALASPDWRLVVAFLLAVAANVLFTAVTYWYLTRRYAHRRPLGLGDMCRLIGAAAVLNYLPLRAGLFGRVAYQRTIHGVSIADSGKTVLWATGLSGAVACVLVLAAVLPNGLITMLPMPIVLGVAIMVALRGPARDLGAALVFRQLDGLAWAVRYWLVFKLIHVQISPEGVSAVAGVGMLASFIPLTSNGLGLREWGVGLTAGQLPRGWVASSGSAGASGLGLTADLLNRAGELVVIVPVGLIAIALLHRDMRRMSSREPAENDA